MAKRTGGIVALLALVVTVSFGGGDAATPENQQQEAARFKDIKWVVIRSVDAIDPAVLIALKSHFGKDNRLANVGSPFNATDVVDGRPARRLLVVSRARCVRYKQSAT